MYLYIAICDMNIHVILTWNEIWRSAIFDREIRVPDREVFSWRKKKTILVAKIIISSTVDPCKMFICQCMVR